MIALNYDPNRLEYNQIVATKLPNASQCFVCGLENPIGLKVSFYVDEQAQVTATVVLDDRFQGYPGVAHGGVVATLLDETLARAVMATDPNRFMMTGRLTTRYRKPTPLGVPLRLVGKVLRDRGRLAECAAYLYAPDGTLTAEAVGLLTQLPSDTVDQRLESDMEWRVVPDE
jgi:acyl-coenzyme A thioesterase PaaI-like protein